MFMLVDVARYLGLLQNQNTRECPNDGTTGNLTHVLSTTPENAAKFGKRFFHQKDRGMVQESVIKDLNVNLTQGPVVSEGTYAQVNGFALSTDVKEG